MLLSKKNFSVENFMNSKKFFDGKQSIRHINEVKSKRKEYSSDSNISIIDIELTYEHESMIRKVLFEKKLITEDIPEEIL